MDLRHSVAVRATLLPPLALGVVMLVILVCAACGLSLLWPTIALNPAEAIATGDEAAFIRLMKAGADPNARTVVRAGLRDNVDAFMTPLQSAIDTRSKRALDTVFAYGGMVKDETARRDMCLAYGRAPEFVPLLKARGAPDVDPQTC